jgi:hypothetical protein
LESCDPNHSTIGIATYSSLVHRDLLELMQGQRNGKKPHGSPIVEGCESFESCVALSKQYALKIDIDAIETVGRAQLALGNGLNSFTVSEHMSLIRRIGLRAALHELSSTLVACTLQPRSLLLVTPAPRHTTLPIAPHPTLVSVISPRDAELISAHQLLAVPRSSGVTHDIVEISVATAARLQPFEAGMALDDKLHLLATNG